nr:transcription factor DIVARICATA-like [Ipomoea batatas]
MGLKKYGKGDWRNISRNFVITRTPTQVASHAQKFFIRQHSGGKDKRRASIHDITTVNLNENQTPSPDNKNPPGSTDQPVVVSRQQNSAMHHKMPFHWDHLGLNSAQANLFMSPPYGIDSSYGMNKLQSLDYALSDSIRCAPVLSRLRFAFQLVENQKRQTQMPLRFNLLI